MTWAVASQEVSNKWGSWFAGQYGGRKVLSRAFRSRFLELHVGDLPDSELETILQQRCALAPSYAKKLVSAMRDLYRTRQVGSRPPLLPPPPPA